VTALRLYSYWRSSASHRVRIALGLKGLAFEYAAVHLLREGGEQRMPAHLARNPMAQVPTLEITEDDGTVRHLSQSMAIIEYLDERWPSPGLLPGDPYLRARTRALAEIVNSGIQPLQNTTTMRRVRELGGDDVAWVRAFIGEGLRAYARSAADVAGRFSVGDQPSLADVYLVPQLHGARRFDVALDDVPLLARIQEACEELPAFRAAEPQRQPDATP
jgi:maleylpyruvate isomerase